MKFFRSIFFMQYLLALFYCERESFGQSVISNLEEELDNNEPLIKLQRTDDKANFLNKKPGDFKSRPVNYKGYSMDMSIDTFKSLVRINTRFFS